LELERRVLRRSGSCRGCSNDCKEQSVARGDRDLDVEVDLLRLEEEVVEEGALSVVLPLVVSAAVVALRPRIVVAGEDGEVALDFLASSSARRGERRSMVMGRCEDV
jgi:hypothetical protein